MTYFEGVSQPDQPRFEFLFEIELTWHSTQSIPDTPAGFGSGATYLDTGVIKGPHLNGRVVPRSGADWPQFRPDRTLRLDARYMLEADDGTLILMRNVGYLAGRAPDVLPRIQKWMFESGPEVPFEDYYLRVTPTFEVSQGPYDWLTRTVVVGIGVRQKTGNTIRYFALL